MIVLEPHANRFGINNCRILREGGGDERDGDFENDEKSNKHNGRDLVAHPKIDNRKSVLDQEFG